MKPAFYCYGPHFDGNDSDSAFCSVDRYSDDQKPYFSAEQMDAERTAREAAEAEVARLKHLIRKADEAVGMDEGVGLTYYMDYKDMDAERDELRGLLGGVGGERA